MTSPTMDERRAVALRIRVYECPVLPSHQTTREAVDAAIECMGLEDDEKMCTVRYFLDRLADLIDPGEDVSVSAYDLLPESDRAALDWVREHGGLDEVKRRVWASNELNDKLRSRERKIERLKTALGYADAKNAERREGAKFIKKHGGLEEVRRMMQSGMDRRIELCGVLGLSVATLWSDVVAELRKRLMPEGMEWPRYEDGEPVQFGDMALIDGDVDMVEAVQIWIHGKPVIYGDNGSQQLEKAERVKRPAPAVLAADGKPLREGETVWHVNGGISLTVARIEDDRVVTTNARDGEQWWAADILTHERPDSWERLEEDAVKGTCEYFGSEHCDCSTCKRLERSVKDCGTAKARDLVRRARALAERGK